MDPGHRAVAALTEASPRVAATILAIAGTDSSGGAGIAADLRTADRLGARARIAVTAVTAQSDRTVAAIEAMPPALVAAQIRLGLEDGRVGAVKIGMLANAGVARAVADALPPDLPVVLDPVAAATSGRRLLDDPGLAVMLERLLPRCRLVTPNLPELAILAGALDRQVERGAVHEQVAKLFSAGAGAVLVKGGHADGAEAVDLLFEPGKADPLRLPAPRSAIALRGTGCALASAVAIALARGSSLPEACGEAKRHLAWLFAEGSQGIS